MVGIVVALLVIVVVVFTSVRGIQWYTKSGPYNRYATTDDATEQDRRDLRAEIAADRRAREDADALEDPWRTGEEFGPPQDGTGGRR